MDWLNIDIVMLLEDYRFLIAETSERGVWITLMKFCAKEENGGVIHWASTFNDRRWQQVVGVKLSEIKGGCGEDRLWWMDGENLIVWGYPAKQEAKVKQSRKNGRSGGRPPKEPNPEPSPEPNAKPRRQPREKPRRKPRNRNVGFSPPHTPPLVSLETRKSPPVAPLRGVPTTAAELALFPDISDDDLDRYGPGPPNSPQPQHEDWDEYVTDAPPGMGFDAWLAVKNHPRFGEYLDQADDGQGFEIWLDQQQQAQETA